MEASPTRDRWTEADVAELPVGEHDYFDRKPRLRPAASEDAEGGCPAEGTALGWAGLAVQEHGELPLGLGTLKPFEDGGGLLLRARTNVRGRRGAVTIELPAEWTLAVEVDLLEGGADAPSLVFRPFQVRSWRLERR